MIFSSRGLTSQTYAVKPEFFNLECATYMHVKRRINVQIKALLYRKSVMFRVFLLGGSALIYTKSYQVK
jgi:hypothetical protein